MHEGSFTAARLVRFEPQESTLEDWIRPQSRALHAGPPFFDLRRCRIVRFLPAQEAQTVGVEIHGVQAR